MNIYLDYKNNIKLTFNPKEDIKTSKEYFSNISGYLKKNYFNNFQINECHNVDSINLVIPDLNIDKKFSLKKIYNNSFIIDDSDLSYLNSEGKLKDKLNIWQLYGILNIKLEINYNDYVDIKETKIFLLPSFVTENELLSIIKDLEEKKFINLSFNISSKNYFDYNQLKNNSEDIHYLALRNVYKQFIEFYDKIKLSSTIKRNVTVVSHHILCHSSGKIYNPQKIFLNNNKKIIKLIDRKPSVSFDLAENFIIKNFLNNFLLAAKKIKRKLIDNINEQESIINELKIKNINHRAYDIDELNNKNSNLKKIKVKCDSMIYTIERSSLNKIISNQPISKPSFSFLLSNTYNHNPHYKRINELNNLLNSLISFNYYSLSDIEKNIEQLNDLYEEWSIYILEKTLSSNIYNLKKTKDLLQESFVKKVSRSLFSKPILEYQTKDDKYLIKIFKEKIYSYANKTSLPSFGFVDLSKSKEKCDVYNFFQHNEIEDKDYFSKKCPDISLELFNVNNLNIPVKIITFDCTFTKNDKYSFYKYAYSDTIRLLEKDSPIPKRIVESANCIYYGAGLPQNFSKREHNCYDISLNPNSESNLEKFFVFLVTNNILPEII